jgi:hypothetical protein
MASTCARSSSSTLSSSSGALAGCAAMLPVEFKVGV